jgi:ribosomal protein S18 acetylase RimI-like enzyme
MTQSVIIRQAAFEDLPAAAMHYLGMRRELNWTETALIPDWQERFVLRHLSGMAAGELAYFVAQCDDRLVGSALAIIRGSLSDAFLNARRAGFLANIYVDKTWRRRGIARALTLAALDWLKAAGCERVRLVASESGRPLYESLGFKDGDEMELRFSTGSPISEE